MSPFFQVTLRTLDVDAARAFYARVLGERHFDVVRLHEQAIARGARPHWLGFLDVGEVDAALARFVARGAMSLGPKWVNAQGLEAAPIRDPGGAVVALARSPRAAEARASQVVWHILHTSDVERAKTDYAEICGWHFHEPVDLKSLGMFHPFSFERGAAAVGSMRDIAAAPGIHPHWLFHFEVEGLDLAIDEVHSAGGSVVGPVTIPGGERVAVCDDPQGAAFAMLERAA